MAIATAASWRALPASALTGNHWSGSSLPVAHLACLMTRAQLAGAVVSETAIYALLRGRVIPMRGGGGFARDSTIRLGGAGSRLWDA
jgi:hypothetical protein